MLFSRVYGLSGATPLVVLHGLFGMSDNWVRLSKHWASQYCVHLLDLRNHGQSPHDDEMDYQLMSADVNEYMSRNNLNDVYLLGHSMGGKVAMCTALRHPDRISKLIVADILPKQYPYKYGGIIEGMKTMPLSEFTRRSEADDFLQSYIPHQGERIFVLKNLYRLSEGGFGMRCNIHALEANMDKLLAGWAPGDLCTTDTLFVRGGQSRYIPLDDVDCISRHFATASLETIENAGHWLHADAPQEFLSIIDRFLD